MKTTLKDAQRDQGTADIDNRWKLFLALDTTFAPQRVLYPDCGFDVSPSLVFPDVTYMDTRRAVAGFFDDIEGVLDRVAESSTAPEDAVFRFVRTERGRFVLPKTRFDLVISLNTRPVAENCAEYLRIGGLFLTSPMGRDAQTLARAAEFALAAIVVRAAGDYELQMIDAGQGHPAVYPPQDFAAGAVSLLFRRIS